MPEKCRDAKFTEDTAKLKGSLQDLDPKKARRAHVKGKGTAAAKAILRRHAKR
ncbi:hypothetical protein E5CHR_04244 [Variovorax sp. PBL-E5]|nr:hypothetical protein E5CHR_04244 [Variovorax sp. PBL-E5]